MWRKSYSEIEDFKRFEIQDATFEYGNGEQVDIESFEIFYHRNKGKAKHLGSEDLRRLNGERIIYAETQEGWRRETQELEGSETPVCSPEVPPLAFTHPKCKLKPKYSVRACAKKFFFFIFQYAAFVFNHQYIYIYIHTQQHTVINVNDRLYVTPGIFHTKERQLQLRCTSSAFPCARAFISFTFIPARVQSMGDNIWYAQQMWNSLLVWRWNIAMHTCTF